MNSDQYDPRATVIQSRTEDENRIQEMLISMERQQNLDLSYLICKFLEMPAIKEEPAFMESLFSHHLHIIEEMIGWMLTPSIIIKDKKLKGNFNAFPLQCKQFAKDNWCFYEQLYLAIIKNRIYFSSLLNFLKQEYLDPKTLYTSLGYFEEVMIPFAKYEFSGSYQIAQTLKKEHSDMELTTLGIMLILPGCVVQQIINYSYHSSIYKFIHTAILVSIEDQNERKVSMKALQKLFSFAKQPNLLSIEFEEEINVKYIRFAQNMCEFLENLSHSLKETVENNIEETISYRLKSYLSVFTKVNLIEFFVDTIVDSGYCNNPDYQKKSNYSELQEDILQNSLTILEYTVQIFNKISSQAPVQLVSQIQYLFAHLPSLSKLVSHSQNKSIPISTGQNIKPITFMKYAFFKLLHRCLVCYEDHSELEMNLQKIPILEMVERYLIENRWNNIVHHTLEKICEIVVSKNLNIIVNKNRKYVTDGFLGTLIENFTNRNHIFLNTFNFTTQGNLHSLYVIAKKLAYQLKNSHQLVSLIHQSEPWKKFLMNDLKKYEDKVYEPIIKPSQDDEKKSSESFECLQVDEFDSIKKLIENIPTTKKWPVRDSFKRKTSLSAIFRKSGDIHTFSSGDDKHKSSGHHSHSKERYQNGNIHPRKRIFDNIQDIRKDESFQIDEFQLVVDQSERQRPKLAKSDILKSSSPEKQAENRRTEKVNRY